MVSTQICHDTDITSNVIWNYMTCWASLIPFFVSIVLTLFLLDIAELNLPKTTKISFPNGKDDLMNFEATIKPDEGYYV